ncbi:MAG: fumarylacetoacetase [Gemmatimonadetes bacterium]|nr:fumarylacetoacetase [Gemmatimonadota bacterium]
MTRLVNRTHDAKARSFIESANQPGGDFPIQNLPFGVFRRRARQEAERIGVAIGDQVVDLRRAAGHGLFSALGSEIQSALAAPVLNPLVALGRPAAAAVRERLFDLLAQDGPSRNNVVDCLAPAESVELLLPVAIGDYTDFYASIHHATNVGSMFRPENPLLPNYKYVPIGYHGRASSIVVSGTPIKRPMGQIKGDVAADPVFGPSRSLDYESEIGGYLVGGNRQGTEIPIAEAESRIFGLCLLNDWSARDIQAWEYQPLGPFLAKNFATSVSPWVVTMEALAPFRVPGFDRPAGDPAPLPYLFAETDRRAGGIAVATEVYLSSARMRAEGMAPWRVSHASLASMYWTMAQLVTHHASNGCNLRPGDLIGSGTISGPEKENRGCLLELTWRGAEPVTLPTGEIRRFLADGDEVILRAACERAGAARIGFGECRGVVEPA